MSEISGLMRGKRGLIIGVANQRSLAWGIAKACHAHGAELAFTYQGDSLKKRVEPLAQEMGGIVVGHCDVTEPATIDAVFAKLQSVWGGIDFLVHAIAFSDKDQLDGRYVDTTADNFANTMLISCYSLTATFLACGPIETSRSSIKLGGASASRTQLIGPMSFSGAHGTSCTIIDSQAAIDQTTITVVMISAPLRRHVSASSTVISGTAIVTYCGPAEGIMSGSAAERIAPATRTGYPSASCGPRTFQNPPRPIRTIVTTTAALNTNCTSEAHCGSGVE